MQRSAPKYRYHRRTILLVELGEKLEQADLRWDVANQARAQENEKRLLPPASETGSNFLTPLMFGWLLVPGRRVPLAPRVTLHGSIAQYTCTICSVSSSRENPRSLQKVAPRPARL